MEQLAGFRAIPGLTVIGPVEIEQAFRTPDGGDPLGLGDDWCPRIPIPYFPEQLQRVVSLCQTPAWQTRPILFLALPAVGGKTTSITNQYGWWGVPWHEHTGGRLRHDIFRRHNEDVMVFAWSIGREEDWKIAPAVAKPSWTIGYELPAWSRGLSEWRQRAMAIKMGLSVMTAALDILMLNLFAITTKTNLRSDDTDARTANLGRLDSPYLHTILSYSANGATEAGRSRWMPTIDHPSRGIAVAGLPNEVK